MLLVKTGGPAVFHEWQAAFRNYAPALEVGLWGDPRVVPESVEYALVWEPDHGHLANYPNLKLILSAAAGVDHILADKALPAHVPIVRMVMPETAERMAEFVLFSALGLIRHLPELSMARHDGLWRQSLTGRLARDTTVGVMGLGVLGAATAIRLKSAGFNVAGWSRSPKAIPGIQCMAGAVEFAPFLGKSDVLVNLLPETADTKGILNAESLRQLPTGGAVINVGRGPHLDIAALCTLLDNGHLSGAVLDVFEREPIPTDDPLWRHPKIFVTPHIASTISRPNRAAHVAGIIAAHQAGRPLENRYDPTKGY